MKIKTKKILSAILLLLLVFSSLAGTVKAVSESIIDETKPVSLTIVKYEHAHGTGKNPEQNVTLKDVEFTIYKLDNESMEMSVKALETKIANNHEAFWTKAMTTGDDGKVKFDNLEQGRYLVRETKAPKNVSEKAESFLIDLPRTLDNGTGWNYDVEVFPKNVTVYGDVTLIKYDEDGETPLPGTTWELQVKKGSNYEKYDYEGELVTDHEGKITIDNLPVGDYRLVETKTLDGYILDQSNVQDFTVSVENTTFNFTAINEKPDLTKKEVKLSDGSYGEHVGAFETDTVEWKITTEIPSIITKMKTYKIIDQIPEGLDFVADSVKIEGLEKDTNYTVSETDGNLVITLKPETLTSGFEKIKEIEITYSTKFNSEVEYGKALENSAKIEYTNKITTEGTEETTTTSVPDKAEVHTGKLVVKKTDKEGIALAGAKFKISTSKQNAKNGVYVRGKDGEDIIGVSDASGLITFEGLKYGDDNVSAETGKTKYWITEIESPTYEEDGETKHYNLLSSPVEVEVNANSGTENDQTVKVINKKGFVLPVTGGIGAIAICVVGISLITLAVKLNKKKEVNE